MVLVCFQRPRSSIIALLHDARPIQECTLISVRQAFELNLEGFYICFMVILSLMFIVLPAPALHDLQSSRYPGRIGRPSASCEPGRPEAPPVAPADSPPQAPHVGPVHPAPGRAATDPAPPDHPGAPPNHAKPSSVLPASDPPSSAGHPFLASDYLASYAFPDRRPVQVVVAILLFGDGVIELPVVAEAFQVEICKVTQLVQYQPNIKSPFLQTCYNHRRHLHPPEWARLPPCPTLARPVPRQRGCRRLHR